MRTFADFPEFAARLGGHKGFGWYFFASQRTLRFQPIGRKRKGALAWGESRYIETPAVDVHTFTRTELRAAARLYCQQRREERAATKTAEVAESIRANWIDSLPDRLDEWTVVDKVQKCLVDNIGNFLMPLPTTPTAPADLLRQVGEIMEMIE